MPPPPSTTPITTPIDHETAKKILPIIIMYLLDDDGEAPNPEPPATPPVQSYQWSVHYYINDHLQTPQRLLNGENVASWEADYEAFGKATIATDTIEQHHRFPGQYYDAESGLHYNWNRYYDSEIGRYVTSDPIGLLGGLNTYGYVGGNPLTTYDMLGLKGSACEEECPYKGRYQICCNGWSPENSRIVNWVSYKICKWGIYKSCGATHNQVSCCEADLKECTDSGKSAEECSIEFTKCRGEPVGRK